MNVAYSSKATGREETICYSSELTSVQENERLTSESVPPVQFTERLTSESVPPVKEILIPDDDKPISVRRKVPFKKLTKYEESLLSTDEHKIYKSQCKKQRHKSNRDPHRHNKNILTAQRKYLECNGWYDQQNYLPEEIINPSYSFMQALSEGFSIIF